MSGVQTAPAPWNLKGRVWFFALSSLSKTGSFPAGFAAPHEAEALTSGGEFIGGPGLIQIISYSASPVGPYDELIYLPGRWKYSDGTAGYRITRIYVSTKESTENGRRNWNIPKQVADFDIKTHNGTSVITVTHPGASAPFFQATIKPVPLLSYLPIPFNTHSLGQYFTLVQPPLPAGRRPEEVATTQWAALLPAMKGTARLASITPGIGGKVGDGEGFPALVPWSVGGHMADVDLDFGVPSLSDSR
ncbi:hypothetical protein D9615_005927 [Tricholomella constricta]|uniref:Acetoacetate decarboxylase n=1 Tax=Tricholomella constricta TaxID=117010 RepID=A0A8H5H9J4_9AGAR|nr:hypothetical protein D9615_005927 [Tricholomella constricta]